MRPPRQVRLFPVSRPSRGPLGSPPSSRNRRHRSTAYRPTSLRVPSCRGFASSRKRLLYSGQGKAMGVQNRRIAWVVVALILAVVVVVIIAMATLHVVLFARGPY